MDPPEDFLRRLALNDEKALSSVLTRRRAGGDETSLVPRVELLIQLAAFLAMGAGTPLLREAVVHALAEGSTSEEIVDVLVAVGPAVGLANVVASAPRLAEALGYDLENGGGVYPQDRHHAGGASPGA